MPDWLSVLLGSGLRLGKWATYEMRVTRIVRKRARENGLVVNARLLRHHLYATHFIEKLRDDSARADLRDSLEGFTSGSTLTSDELFRWIEQAVTERAEPVIATSAVGASVRERIDSLHDVVVTGDQDRALWETRLTRVRPSRAASAREIHRFWPRISTVLGHLDGSDRAERLDGWATAEPQFLNDAPAAVWCWLADLAEDAGKNAAARAFLDKALTLGAFPLGYWETRRRWLGGASRVDAESAAPSAPAAPPRDIGHALVQAWMLEADGELDRARAVIHEWEPSTPAEIAMRTLLLARMAVNQNAHEEAVRLALPLFEATGSPAAVLIAAQSLVAQQLFGSSALHASNTADAFTLLIKARDLFRSWQVNSVDVVVLASTVARLMNDPLRALSLTAAEPDGEATGAEAASLKVRAAAALMRADNGDLAGGRALLDEPDLAPATASHLRALIAASEEQYDDAAEHYKEALRLTDDFQEKGQFALRLARLGRVPPFADEQRAAGNAMFADHLRLIADAVGGADGGMQRLQAAAHTSETLSLILSELYETQGETEKQALTLEAAAGRMKDSDIFLAAARVRMRQGQHDDALRNAERARANAPDRWGAYPPLYALLVELYSNSGAWDKALEAAENLVRVSSSDPSAVWALIACQYYAGEFDSALTTWDTMTDHRRPAKRQWIVVWLGLFEQYGELIGGTEDLAGIASDWADDESIRGRILGLLLLPRVAAGEQRNAEPADDQLSEQGARNEDDSGEFSAEQRARAALFGDYFRDFPDGGFKRIDADVDGEDGALLLQRIRDAVGERPDTSPFDAQVFAGTLPLGTVTYAHGGTLAEAVVAHASGVRFSSRGDDTERDIARHALEKPVVVDTTALFFLATLPEQLRLSLMGVFAGLGVSAEQFRDAVAGLSSTERFGRASSIAGGYRGPVALRARIAEETSLDAGRLAALVELMRPLVREERPAVHPKDRLEEVKDDAWYAAAAVAGEARSLWSDDRTLNVLATDFGVQSFSTPVLIDVLEEDGRLSQELAREIRAHLVAERYVHVAFDPGIYADAMALRPGAAMSIASVFEHLDGSKAEVKSEFMLNHAALQASEGVRLERWVSAMVRWMGRISPDAESLASNLALLMRRMFGAVWVVPQTFAYVDAGVTDGLDGLDGHRPLDPLVDEVERVFRITARNDRMMATRAVLSFIAGLNPSDRPRYTAIVLRV